MCSSGLVFCGLQAYQYLREELKTFQGKPIKVGNVTLKHQEPMSISSQRLLFLLPGQDKGQGNRHQHFHAKERLPAGGGEPVCPAALHILLHPTSLQPAAAVPLIQPHHAAGLVCHAQLHRPHTGTQVVRGGALCLPFIDPGTPLAPIAPKNLVFIIRLRHFTTTSSSTGLRRTTSNRPRRPSPSGITHPGTGIPVSPAAFTRAAFTGAAFTHAAFQRLERSETVKVAADVKCDGAKRRVCQRA